MAMAAAEPSPAAVITWARGLATLPATQTPGTLVRPVGVGADEAALVDLAAERLDQAVVARVQRRAHEERRRAGRAGRRASSTRVQAVIGDGKALDVPVDDGDAAGVERSLARRR